jgi:PhnB protein
MPVNPIPEGYHSITPYLIVQGAAAALELYQKLFGAQVTMRLEAPGGGVGHAEMRIGDSMLMLADEYPSLGYLSPLARGGTPVSLVLYVEDVDAVFAAALAAGCKTVQAVKDQFYGDRNGTFTDPFGHVWTVATRIEDVSPEEMKKRMASMGSQGCT